MNIEVGKRDEQVTKTEVEIFGQNYTIKSDSSPDYILRLAEYVDTKMREVRDNTNLTSESKIAILAALYITEELDKIQNQKQKVSECVEKKVNDLIGKLDTALKRDY
ncbi:MAG: cell division protein ZapA [bacterium]